jgi:hypothetical protein
MAATHLLLNLKGSYRSGPASGGVEIWQTGVRLGLWTGAGQPNDVGDLTPFDLAAASLTDSGTGWTAASNWTTEMGINDFDPVDYLGSQVEPAARSLITSAAFCSDVQIDEALLYPIREPDGKVEPAPGYFQGSPAILTFTGTKPSGGGSQGLPPQCSVVASLRTLQTGKRGRGRMYLPPAPTSYMSNLVLSAAATLAIGNAMVTFLEAIRLPYSVGGIWCAPIVTGAPYTNYAAVKNVLVDNVVDTQMRRRRSIEGTTDTSPVDPWA